MKNKSESKQIVFISSDEVGEKDSINNMHEMVKKEFTRWQLSFMLQKEFFISSDKINKFDEFIILVNLDYLKKIGDNSGVKRLRDEYPEAIIYGVAGRMTLYFDGEEIVEKDLFDKTFSFGLASFEEFKREKFE